MFTILQLIQIIYGHAICDITGIKALRSINNLLINAPKKLKNKLADDWNCFCSLENFTTELISKCLHKKCIIVLSFSFIFWWYGDFYWYFSVLNLQKEVSRLQNLANNGGAENHESDTWSESIPESPGAFKWEGLHGSSFTPFTSNKRMSQVLQFHSWRWLKKIAWLDLNSKL